MSDKFRVLSDRDHILARPSMYIGSMSLETATRYLSGKLSSVEFVPGLLKILNELIDNSVDEFIRTNRTKATKISITMSDKYFKISDNGRGIPVEKYEGVYRPELCWTACRAGTSFNEDRETIGANGVGSTAANIFSLKFLGTSKDGINTCAVLCKKNMEHVSTSITPEKTRDTGCSVYIEPDFERFGIESFSEDIIKLIRERITSIASIYPEITFSFNSETIKCKKTKDYLSVFGEVYVLHDTDKYFISVFPTSTDEYSHKTMFSGLEFHNGGTHEDYISTQIAYELRDLIKKKHKLEMSPAEVKRGLFLIINGHSFPDMKFDSQTKERLTNSMAEVKRYFGEVPISKIAKQILSTDEIILPIIETKLAKQAAIDARAVTAAQNKLSAQKVAKHIKAMSRKSHERRLFLVEGDSAAGMLRKVRNVDIHGGFPLRGVCMNCFGSTHKEIIENKEFKGIMAVLGLQFNKSKAFTLENLEYGKICIMTDADCLEESTLVYTKNGNKMIKDVTIEDKVLSHDGQFHEIECIQEKKTKEYIELELEDGSIIKMSEYEKVPVLVNGEIIYKYAKNLTINDELVKLI